MSGYQPYRLHLIDQHKWNAERQGEEVTPSQAAFAKLSDYALRTYVLELERLIPKTDLDTLKRLHRSHISKRHRKIVLKYRRKK